MIPTPWVNSLSVIFTSFNAEGIFFTSCISIEGHRIGLVCPCVSVCLHLNMWMAFTGMHLDHISDEFDGQGQRSRSPSREVFLTGSDYDGQIDIYTALAWSVTSRNHIVMSFDIIYWRHWGKRTIEYSMREVHGRWGVLLLPFKVNVYINNTQLNDYSWSIKLIKTKIRNLFKLQISRCPQISMFQPIKLQTKRIPQISSVCKTHNK